MKHLKKHFVFLALALLFLGSCRSFKSSEMFKTKPSDYSAFSQDIKEYILRPYDKFTLEIYSNKGMNLVNITNKPATQKTQSLINYEIDKDGFAKIPMIGRFKLSDNTINQAENILEKEYSKYFNDPFVKLNVTNRRIFVFSNGSNTANVVPMNNTNFTLIEALAEVGGISSYSKAYRIKLIRGNLNNPQVFMFDLSSIDKFKDANFVLQANDIIYVEARSRYMTKFIQEVSPYLTLISTLLIIYNLTR